MLVIDVETGGLDPKYNPLLSIGAVEYEHPYNTFYAEIKPLSNLVVDAKALQVNGIDLKKWNKNPSLQSVMNKFYIWIQGIKEQTLAGHNPSFDRDFCNVNFRRIGLGNVFNHRTIDLHSVAYTIFTQKKMIFSRLTSDEIYWKLGLPIEPKPHNALNGALWETEAFARLIHDKKLGLVN